MRSQFFDDFVDADVDLPKKNKFLHRNIPTF